MMLDWLEQTGCKRPPLILKSTCPVWGYSPYPPEFVWITSTKLASSLVNRKSPVENKSMSGLAGSKPINKTYFYLNIKIKTIYFSSK